VIFADVDAAKELLNHIDFNDMPAFIDFALIQPRLDRGVPLDVASMHTRSV